MKQFHFFVIIVARNEELGQKAVEELSKKGLTRNPKFHQLDITDGSSIDRIRDFLKATYGGLDILVNNAGISYTVVHFLKLYDMEFVLNEEFAFNFFNESETILFIGHNLSLYKLSLRLEV